MKKLLIPLTVIAITAIASCNNKQSDSQLQHEADSIKIVSAESERDSLLSLVGEISASLSEVNQLEGIVASPEFNAETPQRKQEIVSNIVALRNELANRRAKLDELEQRLKKSGKYDEKLRSTIEKQKELIEQQEQKIADMQKRLEEAHIKIEQLSSNVDSLHKEVGNITAEKEAAEQRSEAIGNELNLCYYALGSNKELKAHNILEKKFLGKTKILEKDFDRSYFTKADKRTLHTIHTYSNKIKVLTKQPVNSYEITDGSDGKIIKITNPTLFWEKSDFLVIETE